MKRSKLRNFLFPSIAFHLGLVAIIALAVIHFVEKDGQRDEGTIIVGIVEGEGPSREGEITDETTTNEAQAPSAKSDAVKVEKTEPVKPVLTKAKPSIKTDTHIPVRQQQLTTSTETKNETKNVKAATPKVDRDSKGATGETKGTEIVKADTTMKAAGTDGNPALGEKVFSSAYPDYKVNPKPLYPTAARRRGYEGDVKLRVLVLENGKVGKIVIEKPSGYEVLDESALKTVNDWIFVPGTENGKEVSSWVTVPISFRLKSG